MEPLELRSPRIFALINVFIVGMHTLELVNNQNKPKVEWKD